MMKHVFLFMLGCLLCGTVKAQKQQLFDEYRREAGDQAEMFLGKAEPGYPSAIYMNHPYWLFNEFSPGHVLYNGLWYKNVSLRYDAYLQQLVVNTPVTRSNVYVTMDLVEKFTLGETDYVRRNGEFMAILYSSPRMELVEQVRVTMKELMVDNAKVKREFRREVKYYILRGGMTHEVGTLNSLVKLFPGRKKALKSFAKAESLDFKLHRQSALMMTVKYVDELLQQPLN